jgi:acyl-CoA synthetase (AMP-forming)/AMP-acid ligase II
MTAISDVNAGFAYLSRAPRWRDDPAIFHDNLRLTHGALADITVAMARHMQRQGAGRGSVVGVRSEDVTVTMASLLATALIGARWVFASGSELLRRRAGVTLVLDSAPDPADRLPGAIPVDASWARMPADAPNAPFPGHADPDEPWLISRTSGTTGTPKLVGLSPRVVAARNALNSEMFPHPGICLCGLFASGAPGQTSRYLSALLHGGRILADLSPEAWARHRPDLVFGSPSQLRTVLGDRTLPEKLPRVHLAGSTAPEKLVRHLLLSFDLVTNGYGSTEGFNCLSVRQTLGPDGAIRRETALRPGVAIEIVDAEDRPLPVGQEGIVRLRNGVLAGGYVDAPDLTARVFRDGWFYPGDLGRWTEAGDFEVTGRINDQYNLGGVKVNAAVLDHMIQNVPGVLDAVTFVMPGPDGEERLTAFYVLEPGALAHDVLSEARLAAMRVGGQSAVPKRFLPIDRIPRTQTGKPDRAACAAHAMRMREAARARRRGTADTPD